MRSLPEFRLRGLVADTLGVGPEDLALDVSLTDDLAADSLDIAELAVRLENELGVSLPDGIIERVRTYGDLVRAALAAPPPAPAGSASLPAVPIWARLVSAHGERMRADVLTPYVAELIADEVLRAGHGSQLELSVPANTPEAEVRKLRTHFAWLRERGITVTVGHHPRAERSEAA
jgi:acyl carrier protein